MITRTARLGAASLALALTAVLLTACAGATPPAPEVTEPSAANPSATGPAPEPSAEPTEVAPAEDPTCDTIISEDIVADFKSIGWTSRAEPFYIDELEVSEGLRCVWADFEGPAGDHLQMFGWAPIEADAAVEAEDTLVSHGWVREDGPDGVYVTESAETIIAPDAEGYGMTYYFGDGWVTVADTKQGLVLIEWPKA